MVKRILLILAFVLIHPLVVWGASISGDFSTSLTSHWEMEETSSTRMDSTASNNDLTENGTGGVGYATGIQGNASDFERGDTDYLSIADASQTGLDLSGDFSMSFWMYKESDVGAGQTLIGKDGNTNALRSYVLTLSDSSNDINLALFPTSYSYPNYYQGTLAYTFNTATWYHIVVTVDISEATNKIYVYINGSGVGYMTKADGTGATSIQNGAAAFTIGNSTYNGAFDGLIDEVSIWSGRILNSTEVSTIYNAGAGIAYSGGTPPATTYLDPPKVIRFE